VKFCSKFWTTHYFINFIHKISQIFHHIFTLMPSIIQCMIKGTFIPIIMWNPILQFCYPCIIYKFHSILSCEQLKPLKNQWLEPTFECTICTMHPLLKKKKIRIITSIKLMQFIQKHLK
jgi:hypothetical protein